MKKSPLMVLPTSIMIIKEPPMTTPDLSRAATTPAPTDTSREAIERLCNSLRGCDGKLWAAPHEAADALLALLERAEAAEGK